MTSAHPQIERYMSRFDAALRRHGLREWAEISSDLRSHIDEAIGYGKPVEAVLRALGPAESLARAYAVELLMEHPAGPRRGALGRYLGLAGLLAAGSVVTLLVVMTLGSIGVGLLGSGVVLVVIGALEAVGVHLPGVRLAGLPPLAVLAMGPVVFALGWGAAWALWRYLRFAAGALMRVLPRASGRDAA